MSILSPQHKITPDHLDRQAFIYVRQSTLTQVRHCTASTARQYALVRRAEDFGWPSQYITIIDQDQGRSGAAEREGFQHLVAEVGLGHAGAVFCLEASRLARRSSDWHRLLEICALAGTLVIDEEGLYDPGCYNDRLLLGFKGAMSEAELHWLHQRLCGGRLEKARQGQLRFRLPAGYRYDVLGRIVFDPDEQVQEAVRVVFDLFDELGSACAVVKHFAQHELLFPARDRNVLSQLTWRPLTTRRLCAMLHNPLYAGAYVYGRSETKRCRLPGQQGLSKPRKRWLKMEDWAVLIREAHPAYISWDQYLCNRERLDENRTFPGRRGAARAGSALLQGIALCGLCGRRMSVSYRGNRQLPYYVCNHVQSQRGGQVCQTLRGDGIDEQVACLFLEAMRPAELAVSIEALDHLEARARQVERQWTLRIERAQYEADLARRRYLLVEPENRLVSRSLERDWNEKLSEAERMERLSVPQAAAGLVCAEERARILALAQDLPTLWHASTTTHDQRKQLVRLLVKDVTLNRTEAGVRVGLRWQTEAVTEVEVLRRKRVYEARRTDPAVIERVRELAPAHPDDRIAAVLNEAALIPHGGTAWTGSQVRWIRHAGGIASGCPEAPRHCPSGQRGDGRYSAQKAAELLRVSASTITVWCTRGRLDGVQAKPHGPWWVHLTPEQIEALRKPECRCHKRRSPP